MSQYYIYKLVCDDCDDLYVGSTKSIKDRKYKHKSSCNNENDKAYHYKLYTIIRENGGWDHWRMVCIEECDENTKTKTQARMREEYYRSNLTANMNSKRSFRSDEVNKIVNRDDKNRYREINHELIAARKKAWYGHNKEYMHTQQKNYREGNKDLIQSKLSALKWCDCGCNVQYRNLPRHLKSNKHQIYMNNLEHSLNV